MGRNDPSFVCIAQCLDCDGLDLVSSYYTSHTILVDLAVCTRKHPLTRTPPSRAQAQFLDLYEQARMIYSLDPSKLPIEAVAKLLRQVEVARNTRL